MRGIDPIVWLPLTLPIGVCRGMQFVMNDKLFQPGRKVIKKLGSYPRYSITCPWCTSLQLALIAVALLSWGETRRVVAWLLMAAAVSEFAVLWDRIVDRVPLLEDGPPPEHDHDLSPEPPAEVRALLDRGQ